MNNADGTVTINFNIPTSDADAAIKDIEDRLKNLEGTQTDPKVGADTKEAREAINTLKDAFDSLPKRKQTELEAIAKKQGFTSFQDALEHLPKDKLTQLKADAEKGKLTTSEFGHAIKDIPRDHTTDIKANDEGTPKLKKFVFSLKDAIKASMAYEVVQRALTDAMSLFGDVVSRYDTLNNYPKILEGMGASADGAKKSITSLKNGIMGLPTSLNEIAALNERVMPAMGGNINLATKATLALNDAFVSSNATTEDTSRGMTQYIQMLEAGKVDQMSWLTLVQTMNPALQKVAKSFGIASGSQHKLYQEIKSGKISMKELTARFAKLDKGVDGFHKQALKSTAGIGTAVTNMKTRVVNGMTDFLGSFDAASKKITGSSIAENINKMSSKIGASLKSAGTYMGQLIPVFSVAGKAIEGVFKTLVSFGKTLGMSFMANVDRVKKSNFDTFWKNVGKSVDSVFKSLKPVAGALGGLAGVIAGNVWQMFANLLSGISKGFGGIKSGTKGISGVITSISQAFNAWYAAIEPLQKPLGEIIGSLASGVIKGAAGIINAIAGAFGNWSSNAKDTSSALSPLTKLLKSIASHKEALEGIGKALAYIATAAIAWKAIVKVFNIVKNVWGGLVTVVKAVQTAFVFLGGVVEAIAAALGISMGAVIAIIAGVVLAVAGLIYVLTHWNQVKKWLGELGKWFSNTWKGISKGVSNFFGGIGKWASKGWNKFMKTIGSWGKSLSSAWNKIWSPLSKGMAKIWKGILKVVKVGIELVGKTILYTIAFVVGLAVLAWRALEKPFAAVWKWLVKVVKPPLKAIGKFISKSIKAISKTWSKVWGAISKFFSHTWHGMVKFFTGIAKWFIKNVESLLNGIHKAWSKVWNAISDFFGGIWNDIVKIYKAAAHIISKGISSFVKAVQNVWNSTWRAISNFFGGIWHGMIKFFTPIIHTMSNTIGSVIKGIKNVWNDVWGGIGKFFSGIWDGIKKAAESGINFVIDVIRTGLGAINAVLGFFGVKKVGLPKHVKFAQGGEMGANGTRLAMVNDDGTNNYKELIHKKSTGQWLYTDKKNAILPLETGDRVYNGMQSKAIAQRYGIPGFASGGVIGSLWNGVKDASSWVAGKAEDVGKWIGDKWKAITDWIAHPIKHVTELINKSIKGIVNSAPVKAFGSLGSGIFRNAYDGIGKWIKGKLEKVKKTHDEDEDGGGGKGSPSGAGVQRWRDQVKQALDANHLSTSGSMINRVLRQIATESGGNEHAVQGNIGDINNITGDLAKGLMQTISTTFNANKFPGHGNIFNGYDNLLAALNYAKHRYGSGLSFLGNGHGYANGGWSSDPAIFGEASDSPEVAINPHRDSADTLIPEALIARITANPNSPLTRMLDKDFESMTSPQALKAADTKGSENSKASSDISEITKDVGTLTKLVAKSLRTTDATIAILNILGEADLANKLKQIADKDLTISAKNVSEKATPFTSSLTMTRYQQAKRGVSIDNRI